MPGSLSMIRMFVPRGPGGTLSGRSVGSRASRGAKGAGVSSLLQISWKVEAPTAWLRGAIRDNDRPSVGVMAGDDPARGAEAVGHLSRLAPRHADPGGRLPTPRPP